MTDAPPPDADQPIGLDLVAPEMYAPALRRLALAALVLAVVIGVVVALLFGPVAGLVAGLVVAVPPVGQMFLAPRRRLLLRGSTVEARRLLRTRRLDVTALTGIELLVTPARVSRVALRLTAGPDRRLVPLALYTDSGSGRELHLLGLRRLADALMRSELPSALLVADVLVHQLRAEARDAGPAERPLYRAVLAARAKDYVGTVGLSDPEITSLY